MGFGTIDIVIVVLYMIFSAGVGAWIGRGQKDTRDYFLGGRQIPWYAVTFSIVATETSVLTFLSIPAVSYLGNMTFLQIAIGYIFGRIVVAMVFIPAYFKGEISTAYEFLGKRFGMVLRRITSITFMFTRLLADGVRLFATAIPLALIIRGGGFFQQLSNSELYGLSILFIGILTMIYTYIGGIRSVIWMDMVQMIIYIGGAMLAGYIMLDRFDGGLATVMSMEGVASKFEWFYSGFDLTFAEFIKKPYTFFTALIAGAIFSLASHGTDQLIVQRVLTCKDERAGKRAIVLSGIIVFLQFGLFLVIGVLLYAFFEGQSLEALGLQKGDEIFSKFIVEEMPSGISGIIIAALFAAAMSTLSSSLSSLSSAAVLDIYLPLWGSGKSEAEQLKISRIMTLVWGVILIGAAMLFIGLQGTQAVELALGIASYTYGGLLGVFLFGLINKSAGEVSAIVGFAAALITMTLVIQLASIAWPLYTVVGSLTTIVAGTLYQHFFSPAG